MKHRIAASFLALSISLVLFTALPVVAQAGPSNSPTAIFPPSYVQSTLAEAWCREVEKRTDGKVTVDLSPGGTTKAQQCYDGVVEGLSDIGFSVLAYTRGRFRPPRLDLPLG